MRSPGQSLNDGIEVKLIIMHYVWAMLYSAFETLSGRRIDGNKKNRNISKPKRLQVLDRHLCTEFRVVVGPKSEAGIVGIRRRKKFKAAEE